MNLGTSIGRGAGLGRGRGENGGARGMEPWTLRAIGMATMALVICLLFAGCGDSRPKPLDRSKAGPASAGSTPETEDPWFEEVSQSAGIAFRHCSGHRERFYMPEINTGGIGLLDFDRDGWLDILCINGGSVLTEDREPAGHRLYRNLGGWKFADVTERSGLGLLKGYGMGVSCADYDGDGWTDVLVLNLRTNALCRNRGDGTFEEVTAQAGVGGDEWSSSAAFFDADGDGDLDLFVVNYLYWSLSTEVECSSRGGVADYCSPLSYRAPAKDRLYLNRGDGTFADASQELGIDRAFGNGLGVATGDFDRDGRVDVFVANDAMPNQLWMNRGDHGFQDEAMARGCAVNAAGIPRAGMGVVAMDVDGGGWLSLFVTHLVGEGNGLFINRDGFFSDVILPRGPMRGSWPRTGFGVAFRDFDHDGEPDVYIANGRVRLGVRDLSSEDPYAEPNTLLKGLGGGEFAEAADAGGTRPVLLAASRGAAFGDVDNDGAEDVVILNRDGPVHLLRNRVGHRGNWLGLDVRRRTGGVACNAMVRVHAGNRVWVRQVQPNDGYASSHDHRLVFGLGTADRVERVTVSWPSGGEETFGPFAAGDYQNLIEGKGTR